MTKGDLNWIKKHTEKTFKGSNMKSAKKIDNPIIGTKKIDNPIIGKLLNLKYRIDDTATTEGGWSDDMSTDKRYVQSLINDIRKHNFTKIAPEDAHCCNGLWKKYV
tara:strand:+ start:647 stop:964 length:318 start_codon:yes stop_codon:yes gene_type:complete